MSDSIDIFLLDDHKIVRDGLKSILALYPAFRVVGEEGRPLRFLSALPQINVDILILDMSLPEMSGIEVLREVKILRPDISVVVLSMHNNPEYMIRAFKAGAAAYLSKDIQSQVLVDALIEVKKNGVYYPSDMSLHSQPLHLEAVEKGEVLTHKEKEVLKWMEKGLSSKQIAAEFGLSSRTIETHRLNIMKKLGTSNSAETIAVAIKHNLL